MNLKGKALLAACAVSIAGLSALWLATDGGRALTSESARRLRALAATGAVPPSVLEDSRGREILLRSRADVVTLVEFIYTTCPTVCQSAGDAFFKVRSRVLQTPKLAQSVRMLSISFDVEKDGPDRLDDYARGHEADGQMWKVVRARRDGLPGLLDAFGVVVIPNPAYGYTHNAAIHVVRQDGHLAGIYDLEDIDGVMANVRNLVGPAT